ncbi:AbrB/MazE/SpoVT family DNA-binding domain-containing protein [Bacillus arachidis]|uniref:AbrB/MazE/SpoVT family DNA-binding domain-containing protein n=1 Tax=Bacillus arachidis TaxID=2819290 RepID=UPI00255CE2AC|nr:AbrB/MazE/SpoVT family DNA-binding domain-containing protein [Bacillus arachidis]WIY58808.1 AbrB/MazE/SpoVT family DNA-binding domain-containing protein [Bacillus arachidis]
MKSTKIPLKVDELGLLLIPKVLRDTLDIKEKSSLEIFVEGEQIVLQKYQPGGVCAITGAVSDKNISLADGKIMLSPEGAELLIEELQKYLVK